jgi:hypothetical protein
MGKKRCKGVVPGTRTMQADKTRGKFTKSLTRSAGREGAHHVFTIFFLVNVGMTGEEMVMRRCRERRGESDDRRFCLFVCLLAYM